MWPATAIFSLSILASILNVRVGTGHLDFVRVVFDLDGRPNAEVAAEKGRIVVRLGNGEEGQWEERSVDCPPIEAVRWWGKGAEVLLSLPSVRFRHFVLDQPWRLVLDIRRPEGGAGVGPGVTWERRRVGDVVVNMLSIDPGVVEVRPIPASEGIRGRAPVGAIARSAGALAAVNGGYFDPNSGTLIGMLVLFREWFKTPDAGGSALLVLPDGRPKVSQCNFVGTVKVGETIFPLDGINISQGSSESLVAYNSRYGPRCPWSETGATRVVVEGGMVEQVLIASRALPIPEGGWVLSATGRLGWELASVAQRGQRVEFSLGLEPGVGEFLHARGAGPMLVKEGKVVVGEAIQIEGIGPEPRKRRARTAVGLTPEGRLLLVAVERLPGWSEGATLFELADIVRQVGASEVMNLDGGGSTMMFAKGENLVEPEKDSERPVTDAIVVLPHRPLGEISGLPRFFSVAWTGGKLSRRFLLKG